MNSGFVYYRLNPFQFPYKEYYITPDTIVLSTQANFKLNRSDSVTLKNISFFLDTAWFDRYSPQTVDTCSIGFYKKNRKRFVVSYSKENRMGCLDSMTRQVEKDFCSCFSSSEDYFYKLFTLTPEQLGKDPFLARGYDWIVHNKGSYFQNVRKISIYQKDDLVAFRRDFVKSGEIPITTELVVFPKIIVPDYVTVILINPNEALLNNVLYSVHCNSDTVHRY